MAHIDELRLISRIARMYYEWDMRQSEIANQLGLSQASVSRMLKRSEKEGIVRISVNPHTKNDAPGNRTPATPGSLRRGKPTDKESVIRVSILLLNSFIALSRSLKPVNKKISTPISNNSFL